MAEEDSNKALHYDTGKSALDQIPPEALLALGDVYAYGEKKYNRNNWRKGNEWYKFYGSALRHLLRWQNGEDIDSESGLPHLAHAMWNVVTLMYFQNHNLGEDTREGK